MRTTNNGRAQIVTDTEASAQDLALQNQFAQMGLVPGQQQQPDVPATVPTTPVQVPQGQPTMSDLEARLAALQAAPQTVPTTQPAAEPTQPSAEQVPTQPEASETSTQSPEELQQLASLMEKFFGIRPETFQQQMDFVAQQQIEAQKRSMMSEWGVDQQEYARRESLILERFNKLPEPMKAALDNPDGMRLLWNDIQATQAPTQVPAFDRSTAGATGTAQPGSFTRAEIEGMDEKTYAKYADQIMYAYANGLIK
jgi:DNA polymerase III gamma/tau subunit